MAKVAAAGFVALSIASLKFASDAEEAANLFQVSMGKMHKGALKFVEDYSQKLGLLKTEMMEYMGVFNVMIKGMGVGAEESANMSKELTKLAFDISSFRNIRPEEAFEKLRAGITGESEPLKSLGILMKDSTMQAFALAQGIRKQWKEMSEAEKVLLRYQFILEKTKDDQGDLARTSDGLANSFRRFKNVLVGLLEKIGALGTNESAGFLNAISDWVKENEERVVGFFVETKEKIVDWVKEMGGISGIASRIEKAWEKMGKTFKEVILPVLEDIWFVVKKVVKGLGFMLGMERKKNPRDTLGEAIELKQNADLIEGRFNAMKAGARGRAEQDAFAQLRATNNPLSISDEKILETLRSIDRKMGQGPIGAN